MKKIISMLVSLAIVSCTFPMMIAFADVESSTGWDGTAATAYSSPGHAGTAADPILIANAAELALARDNINAGEESDMNYKLTADIDLNNQEWTPIGGIDGNRNGKYLNATFDGDGHVIKNLKITSRHDSIAIGLFGYVNNNGAIKNLGIDGVNIEIPQSDEKTTGALVGQMYAGTISNCYVKNANIAVNGYAHVGGMIGEYRGTAPTTVENCYVKDAVLHVSDNRTNLGGISGGPSENRIYRNCYTSNIKSGAESNAKFYPFAYNTNKANNPTTIINCYTDSDHRDSSHTDPQYQYNADHDLITTKSTKKQIKDGLATVSSYVIDSTINNGYPALYYEADDAWDGVVATGYADGNGTQADPYQIATPGQLAYFAQQVNAGETYGKKYFKLTADINLGNQEWTPIGILDADWNPNRPFSGIFDGDGHVVKNMKVTSTPTIEGNKAGLFGYINGGTIKNVGIVNANVSRGTSSGAIGGLVGHSYGGITVENCYVKDSVIYGDGVISGLIGKYRAGINTFTNCYVIDTVVSSPRGANKMAGFGSSEGDDTSVTFTNCYTANITRNATGDQSALYPFVCTYGARGTQTATNCYTNTMSLDATTTGTYNANYALVGSATAASTKAEIVSGLVTADGAYMIDVTKNGGYPALNWEPKAYVISAITTGDDVKVTLAENEYVVGSTLYVATYDNNNRLIDAVVVSDPVNGQNKTGLSSEGAAYVKAFVWNGDLAPFATSKSVPVQQ